MRISEQSKPISLHTNGRCEVTFLGVGSAFATKHFNTNALVVQGNTNLLIDFGITGPTALRALGLSFSDIQSILPTHAHADHIGAIEQLALHHKFVEPQSSISMIATEAHATHLWERSLCGGLEWIEDSHHNPIQLKLRDYFTLLHPIPKMRGKRMVWVFELENLRIELFKTNHIGARSSTWKAPFHSYGLFINNHIFYSGDTQFDAQLLTDYAPHSSAMFHDVQFSQGGIHTNLQQLRTLPEDVRSKMVLMHLPDDYLQHPIPDFHSYAVQGATYIFD